MLNSWKEMVHLDVPRHFNLQKKNNSEVERERENEAQKQIA